MPEVIIGKRTIAYEIRRSSRAKRKRIEVRPEGVHVIVPPDARKQDIERFVQTKRRWLYEKTDEIRGGIERLRALTPEGFHSGAKILYRGRYMKLRVRTAKVVSASMRYRSGFDVVLPEAVPPNARETAVRDLIAGWLDERLRESAWEIIRQRGRPHGLEPRDVRIRDQQTLWGSCGRDEVIRLDRKLARVPKAVFEYVVVHELCHLAHRDHSPAFWGLVRRVLPDYPERKRWLEQHEVQLG